MIERFIDPSKIDLDVDCIETGDSYIGERVVGKSIRAFELVENEDVGDGIKIVGELKDVLGIVIKVSEIDEMTASALESLIPTIMNRIKGLRYDFRKENVKVTISDETFEKLTLDCIGEIIYKAFKSLKIGNVYVNLIADRNDFKREIERSRKIHEKREKYKIKEEDVTTFYGCISCQVNLPNHVCIITPERPSPCGTTWNEARVANKLKVVSYYFKIEKGKPINGEYEGVNEAIRKLSDGTIERVKIHSVLKNPPSTGLYSQLIVFYIPEKKGFGIVDRGYFLKTPIGLSFEEIEKIILGKQVEGFVGISYPYLHSPKFIKEDGGWKKVFWVSPKVYEHVKTFLNAEELSRLKRKV